jgi:antirestriction protein ArdC
MARNVYQEVTDRIIEQLESGAAPWIKPWKAGMDCSSSDRNVVSHKPYRGINRILLAMAGRSSSQWGTYKQWQEKGAQVAKGEKSTHIVFFRPITGKTDAAGEKGSDYLVIRDYSVFNADQTDIITECEQTIANTGAVIRHGGDQAFFAPSRDIIQLPNKEDFSTAAHYYSTAFHELGHWTGAKKRLERQFGERFGNPEYAFEELIAEMCSAYLCADHQLQGELRHAVYISHWLKTCRDDNKAIFKAAALAQKAADFIVNAGVVEAEEEEQLAA